MRVTGQRRVRPAVRGPGISPVVQVQGQRGADAIRPVGADLADDQVVAARHEQGALVPRVPVAPSNNHLAAAHVQRSGIVAERLACGHGHDEVP